MRERYVVSAPGNSLYESYVFRCSPKQNSTYVLQLAEYILILFFRRHGSTRVRMYLVILQSNILVHTFFQVEVTTVTSVHFSERNLTRTVKHFRFQVWFAQEYKVRYDLLSNLLILCSLTEIPSPTTCDQG